MNEPPARRRRRFVSRSARQRQPNRPEAVDLPPTAAQALRAGDALRWPTALGAARCPTNRDDLCAAHFRSAAGFDLLADRPVRTDDHLLIVVMEGDLVIGAAGVLFAVREGGSAVVPPGEWRLSEVPATGRVGCWLLFFGPALLAAAIGGDPQALQLAAQATPARRGVFVQAGLPELLRAWGQATPAADPVQTVRALAASMCASFYIYLREHYHAPRQALQDEVRRRWADGARKLGAAWPGGPAGFGREFRRYHGVSLTLWARRWLRAESNRRRN